MSHRSNSAVLFALALAGAAGLSTSTASAQPMFTASATSSVAGSPNAYSDEYYTGSSPQAAGASAYGTYFPGVLASGTALASASAGPGVLRASASASQLGGWNDGYNGAYATAHAEYVDDITVMPANPALLGTPGTFTASMTVSGSFSAQFSGGINSYWSNNDEVGFPMAGYGFGVSVNSAGVFASGDGVSLSGYVSGSETRLTGETCTFVVPFTFGTPFTLGAALSVYGGAVTDGSSEELSFAGGQSLFGNSAIWQGITSIVGGGQEIGLAGASVGAESGADYAHSVPAPGAASLLAIGVMATSRRRRGGRQII